MVIVMTTVWIPHAKASMAGKVFLEALKKFPEDRSLAKNLLNNAVAATKEGYKVIIADEIKEGKLKEYLAQANKQLIFFAESIEGYKYEIEVMSSLPEAMAVLGLEVPE
ncbi:MAG: hypothetical protein HWN81_10820 [Candidatus Lokiarchaeota archaeon]|nr:hypothetical protein [Candidatus Lokiarchaeota archaeon]